MQQCLALDAPCRKYVSCRPSSAANFVCDDGRWPQAHSGCCIDNQTHLVGCPLLCESSRIWRLDRAEGIPWWARWHSGRGIIAQCTCTGCPSTALAGHNKLLSTMENGVWDNGQMMLVDIARRENLVYGPNREMQELMAERNREILSLIRDSADGQNLDRRISLINSKFTDKISNAARNYPDRKHDRVRDNDHTALIVVVVVCTIVVVAAIVMATFIILCRRKHASSPVTGFQQGDDVVVGQPVRDEEHPANPFSEHGPVSGTPVQPVTVSAPMKGPKVVT